MGPHFYSVKKQKTRIKTINTIKKQAFFYLKGKTVMLAASRLTTLACGQSNLLG